jgi:cyclically-permuted mutarotase family protein
MFFSMTSTAQIKKKSEVSVKWKVANVLPPSEGQSKSLGFAGPINGVSNNVLIIAGGANFPNGLPWEGGKKYYSNEIFVLQKEANKFVWNKKVKKSLPAPIAYCGITSTDKGIVYAGGENETGISKQAWIINWNCKGEDIDIKPLPDLPFALTNVALTHIDNVVFAAGGDQAKNSSNTFFSLDLDDFSLDLDEKNAEWKMLPDLPIALANATLIAQKNSVEKNIYLIGGRTKTASGISELHHTTFVFDLDKNEWKKCADISDGKNISNLSAAAGIAIGKNYILVIGGDNGTVFHKIETYISQISKAGSEEEKERLTKEKNALSIHHKGFYKGLLLYNTKEDKWTKIGEYPYPAQVTTTAVKWGNDIVISNGEIKPGVRTPDVIIGEVSAIKIKEEETELKK